MRKLWITCAVIVSCASGLALPVMGEEPQSVAGEWKGFYTGTSQDRFEFYLTLKQDGGRVSGTYFNPGAGPQRRSIEQPVAGTFKEGVLLFHTWKSFKGTVVDGKTMNGSFQAAAGPVLNFTATKVK